MRIFPKPWKAPKLTYTEVIGDFNAKLDKRSGTQILTIWYRATEC